MHPNYNIAIFFSFLKANSPLEVFTNYTIKISITSLNGNSFTQLQGFGMMVDFNTSYYIMDESKNIIFLLNDNYDYVTMKTFSGPNYMVTINSSLYITGYSNVWKTDKYLNILITHNESGGANYNGIYYNCSDNLIYVAPRAYSYIQVFDLNLTLNHTISVSPNNPRSFGEYNHELYASTNQFLVLVIVNKIVIRSFTGCSSGPSYSLVADNYGFIAIACFSNNLVNLYYYNGTSTGKSLTTPAYPTYVGFDSKGRFVLLSQYQIRIYY